MTNGGSNFKINKNRYHNNSLFSQNLNIPTKNRSAIPILCTGNDNNINDHIKNSTVPRKRVLLSFIQQHCVHTVTIHKVHDTLFCLNPCVKVV